MREERSATGLDPSAVTQAAPAPRAAGNAEALAEYISSFIRPRVKKLSLTSTTDLALGTQDFQSLTFP